MSTPLAAPTPGAELPVDPSITPVSRSAPTDEALAALKLCGAATGPRFETISGMGLVPHARDIPRYTYLWGIEPEIQTDAATWVIQMTGKITLRRGWAIDPVCVIIDAVPTLFAPKQYFNGSRVVTPPNGGGSPLDGARIGEPCVGGRIFVGCPGSGPRDDPVPNTTAGRNLASRRIVLSA